MLKTTLQRSFTRKRNLPLIPRKTNPLIKLQDENVTIEDLPKETQYNDISILDADLASKALACALSQSNYFNNRIVNDPILNIDESKRVITLFDPPEDDKKVNHFDHNLTPIVLSPSSIRFLNSLGVLALCDP
jgi:hypothetical protein